MSANASEAKATPLPTAGLAPPMTQEGFKQRVVQHMVHTVGKATITATERDWYVSLAHAVRDLIVDGWMDTNRETYGRDAKRVYYLSMEFLIGRSLIKNLLNCGAYDMARTAMADLGIDLDRLAHQEPEAALGNGGLGRLAACLLDSMATVGIPGYGYGIRYDYGMFAQHIDNGEQVELPDNWLRFGNQWEFARPELTFPVPAGWSSSPRATAIGATSGSTPKTCWPRRMTCRCRVTHARRST